MRGLDRRPFARRGVANSCKLDQRQRRDCLCLRMLLPIASGAGGRGGTTCQIDCLFGVDGRVAKQAACEGLFSGVFTLWQPQCAQSAIAMVIEVGMDAQPAVGALIEPRQRRPGGWCVAINGEKSGAFGGGVFSGHAQPWCVQAARSAELNRRQCRCGNAALRGTGYRERRCQTGISAAQVYQRQAALRQVVQRPQPGQELISVCHRMVYSGVLPPGRKP